MRTASRRSPSFHIPGYNQNAVLQLIVASGSGFILYHLIRVTLIVYGHGKDAADAMIHPFVGLHSATGFFSHFWTVFTYGWVHTGLMDWISNMIWLYCFGNALQMLVSYKQIIPIYIYGLIGGGIVCVLSQLIPGNIFPEISPLTGQAGTMAIVAAMVTLSPNYRFYFGEHISIPLLVVAGIYVGLTFVFHSTPSLWMLNIGGMLTGFLTMTAIKKGKEPGAWMYNIGHKADSWAVPKTGTRISFSSSTLRTSKQPESFQKRVDEILDKINQRGYQSLTKEEREMLVRASRDEK